MNAKIFTIALTKLFLSKGKDVPSEIMVDTWYEALSGYDERVVCGVMKYLTTQKTYGIQIADITNLINPQDDPEYLFIKFWEDVENRVKSGLKVVGEVDHDVLPKDDYYVWSKTTSESERKYIRSKARVRFMRKNNNNVIEALKIDGQKKYIG